jgi:GT2 family glycosyltransferase
MVSIIVPCLNHLYHTKETLKYLYLNTPTLRSGEDEIIVIDDGSNDSTRHVLSECLDYNYTIIRHWPRNTGFAPSVNNGIQAAHGDQICITNNDILVGPYWLEHLQQSLEDDIYMSTSYLVGIERCTNVIEFNSWAIAEQIKNNDDPFLLWCKGGPWLMKRSVFDRIGLFDEQFKYGTYEDTDMFMRMAQSKMLWGMNKRSVAFHYGSITQNGQLFERVGHGYKRENAEKFRAKWNTCHITPDRLQRIYDGETLEVDGL